ELLRQAGVELVERLVRDLAAQHRVGLGVDRLRVDDALEEPGRRAVGEALELGRREDAAGAEPGPDGRVPERGRPVEGAARPAEGGPARRARARRVEEVAVARHLVGSLEPPAERAPPVVVEERRAAATSREAPLLQAEDERDVEAARAGAQEVEDGDPAGLRG